MFKKWFNKFNEFNALFGLLSAMGLIVGFYFVVFALIKSIFHFNLVYNLLIYAIIYLAALFECYIISIKNKELRKSFTFWTIILWIIIIVGLWLFPYL
jgi:uncharacterized membrane protein YuzA (DUF378 family)